MSNSDATTTRFAGGAAPLLASIASLYVSFGMTFGLLQAGLPPILRVQGVEIGSIGWLTAILLPFGLTFLWASWVDRLTFGLSASRICWIVVMQALTALLLAALATVGPKSIQTVFALSLAIAFAAATMDIALDALTSQTVKPRHRAIAGGIKVGSLAVGSIFGSGLFVVYFQQAGWTTIFWAMAVLTSVFTLPILSQTGRDIGVLKIRSGVNKAGLIRVVLDPARRQHLFILAVITVPVVLLFGLNRVMLVDIGLSLDEIGAIIGTISPVASLLATGFAVLLMRRFGAMPTIVTFAISCIMAVVLMMSGHTTLTVAGVIGVTASSSGIYVATSSMILGWTNSDQPATDYATLYGLSRFVALVILMLMAQVVAVIGWNAFYALSGVALITGVLVAARMLSKLKPEEPMLSPPLAPPQAKGRG